MSVPTISAALLGLPQVISDLANVLPVISGNTSNSKGFKGFEPGRKLELVTYQKRPACASNECVSCPYQGEHGSC